MPRDINIDMVMEKDVLTGRPDMTAFEASRRMAERGTGSLIVMENGKPIGIFTERDLLKCVVENGRCVEGTKVSEVMTSKIVSIGPENSLEDAHQAMLKGEFRHLLVTENGRLKGVISIKDLVRVREQVLEQRVMEKTRELRRAQAQLAESLEVIQREMESASKFQKDLINKRYPSVKNMRFSHVYEQAASLGGDFFEVVKIDKKHLGVFMADVMGHGITSAMIAIELKMNFDQLCRRFRDPSKVMNRMNRQLIPLMPQAFFVAGFYGVIELDSLTMDYVQFGLPKPLILKATSSRVQTLPHGNVPLGIKEETQYQARRTRIKPGDSLLLFTDGCIEQKDHKGRFFGEKRFVRNFKEHMSDGRSRIPRRLYRTILNFSGGAQLNDDIAILLCEFLEE